MADIGCRACVCVLVLERSLCVRACAYASLCAFVWSWQAALQAEEVSQQQLVGHLEARLRQVGAMTDEQARFLTSLTDALGEAKLPTPKFRSSAMALPAFDPAAALRSAMPALQPPSAATGARVLAGSSRAPVLPAVPLTQIAALSASAPLAAAAPSSAAPSSGAARPPPALGPEGVLDDLMPLPVEPMGSASGPPLDL